MHNPPGAKASEGVLTLSREPKTTLLVTLSSSGALIPYGENQTVPLWRNSEDSQMVACVLDVCLAFLFKPVLLRRLTILLLFGVRSVFTLPHLLWFLSTTPILPLSSLLPGLPTSVLAIPRLFNSSENFTAFLAISPWNSRCCSLISG